jgi:hypothetical protein
LSKSETGVSVLWFGNGYVFPNFGLEMDEKPGALVWKWSRFSRFLVWKWMKNRVFWFGNGHVFPEFWFGNG